MREIKFRALVPVNTDEPKRMMYYDLVNIDDLNRLAAEDWDINQLMQFTGLKDKNGKEVYEGDIVFYSIPRFPDSKLKAKIIFNSDIGAFQISYPNYHDHFVSDKIFPLILEVIGNIYEQPELLNT